MDEKLEECIALMQDNADKSQQLISALEKERAENDRQGHIIRWLTTGLVAVAIVGFIVIGVCFFEHEYGYFFSPYIYGGEVNQSQSVSGSGVQIGGSIH